MTEQHELIWGLGFRHIEDDIRGSSLFHFILPKRQDNLFSAFMQNEFKIYHSPYLKESAENGGDLRLILGSKFEHIAFPD